MAQNVIVKLNLLKRPLTVSLSELNVVFLQMSNMLNFLQTQGGPIIRPDRPLSPILPVYCYNCGRQGHYGYVSILEQAVQFIFRTIIVHLAHTDIKPLALCRMFLT